LAFNQLVLGSSPSLSITFVPLGPVITEGNYGRFKHPFPFDPTYGASEEDLRSIEAPEPPADYELFWQPRYDAAMGVSPAPEIEEEALEGDFRRFQISYQSVGGIRIRGWMLVPRHGPVVRGFVVAHGYGGRTAPDTHLPFRDAVLVFPCLRGLALSRLPMVPSDPLRTCSLRDRARGDLHSWWLCGGCMVRSLRVVGAVSGGSGPDRFSGHKLWRWNWGDGLGLGSASGTRPLECAELREPSGSIALSDSGEWRVGAHLCRPEGDPMPTLAYYDAATAARADPDPGALRVGCV